MSKMKPTKIEISDYRLIYAVSLASADTDVRHYLQTVRIEKVAKSVGTGLVFTASNGHLLSYAYDKNAKATNLPDGGILVQTTNPKTSWPRGSFKKAVADGGLPATLELELEKEERELVINSEKKEKYFVYGGGGTLSIPTFDTKVDVVCDASRFPEFKETYSKLHKDPGTETAIQEIYITRLSATAKVFEPSLVTVRVSSSENGLGALFGSFCQETGPREPAKLIPMMFMAMPSKIEVDLGLPDFIKAWSEEQK